MSQYDPAPKADVKLTESPYCCIITMYELNQLQEPYAVGLAVASAPSEVEVVSAQDGPEKLSHWHRGSRLVR